MADSTASELSALLSNAVVSFSLDGRFPDAEQVSSLSLSASDLSPAIQALAQAKKDLEAEVHTINEETKGEVASWIKNAKSLQEDILRSKSLANDIDRQSEAPDVSGKAIHDAEERVKFLNREAQYSQQLHDVLIGIEHVNQLLGEVEAAMNERRVLDSLRLLEKSWTELDQITVSKSCRVMKLLDLRAFELKSDVHEVFDRVWNGLVHVDLEGGKVSIYDERDGEQMKLSDAVIGLKAYKEVDERMIQLWHNVDVAIVSPRMNTDSESLPSIHADENFLELKGRSDRSVHALLADLEKVTVFLAKRLPRDLLQSLSAIMMDNLIPKLLHVWLDSAVPVTLKDIDQFQGVIHSAGKFCSVLEENGYSGFSSLKEWVGSAPSIWLSKCRETTLDSVRTKLSNGIGKSKQVERVEKQMVTRAEGKDLAANGPATVVDDDWGAAWGDDDDSDDDEQTKMPAPKPEDKPETGQGQEEEDDGADAWGWGEEDGADDDKVDQPNEPREPPADEEDDSAAAWGWGDEDPTDDQQPSHGKSSVPAKEEIREMVLKETYNISSMPDPVLELIFSILEDGASLTREGSEASPVASAAAGLFGLPTFALALFRAISPYYYSLDLGGNMFLYNDARYLAERLADFAAAWKSRDDLSKRAQAMLRLDNDIKSLQSFASRAYSSELTVQKTVLKDLLGGAQSLMQQDEIESCVDSAVARLRSMAVTWEPILARSAWYQAIGALADTISVKIITDVLDMPSIGQDEAYSIAQTIAKVTEIDDLFLPSRTGGAPAAPDEFAVTPQYVPSWLRLKFLSEVLQSNLNEVRYLWFESELSLYFTAEEVVDLISVSFEANARAREVIKEIAQTPHPVQA